MNLDMFRPQNKTEASLLSFTKVFEKSNKQTHKKSQETQEFKLTQLRDTFSIKPSVYLGLDTKWIIVFTNSEIHSCSSNITEEKGQLEQYTGKIDEFEFTELKDELEDNLGFSEISAQQLQNKMIGPRILKVYQKKLGSNREAAGYIKLILGYARSPIRDL